MNPANRVVFNTGILYTKSLFTAGISLYSTRLILNSLGESDFGIFVLVGGVVALLSFLNTAMSTSTQRYLSFHQGSKDLEMQKKVFTNSWMLHIGIGLFVVFLLALLKPFLFNGFLNIPIESIGSAKTIYLFMIASIFITIITVPFAASLNAHENIPWIAIVGFIEAVLKLSIALSLSYFLQNDRLVVFGLMMAGLNLICFLLYAFYCLKKYDECSIIDYKIDKPLLKELTSFAGWNLFGTLCGIARAQGLVILFNVFFGTIIIAAYGIANQISSQMNFFSATLLRALNPQIMKSEGMNDRQRTLRISMMASKCGFFLLAFIAIPCIFEMPAILKFWLGAVPEYTVVFCSLVLVAILTNQLTIGLQSAIQATGKIKVYQAVVGSTLLFNLPVAYFLLYYGFEAYSVLLCLICIELVACFLRLFFLKKLAGLSIREYFSRVFLKEAIPTFSLILICWIITNYLSFNFRFLFTFAVSIPIFFLLVYRMGLCRDEKLIVNDVLKSFLQKLKK